MRASCRARPAVRLRYVSGLAPESGEAYGSRAAVTERGCELGELLEIWAHGVTAILATWLGLLVATRAQRSPGAPILSLLFFLLVTWCVAIIVQRIGTDPSIYPTLNLIEDAAAFLVPAVTAHLAISVAVEGRRPALATAVIVFGYVVAALAIVQAAVDPGHPIQFAEPNFQPFGISGTLMAWLFAGVRAFVWAVGIGYLVIALRDAGEDRSRRRQLGFAIATLVIGVIGGMLRILPEDIGGPRWVGVTLVAIAMTMAVYAVLAQRLFLTADAAGRALRWSIVAGLGIVLYVGALITLDEAASSALGIDFPLVTTLALIVTIALFDPIAERVRRTAARTPQEAAESRLARALGDNPVLTQAPDDAIEPALSRLVRAFDLRGATLAAAGGETMAAVGDPIEDPGATATFVVALSDAPDAGGRLTFGPKRSGLPYARAELQAMELAAAYLGSSVRLAERRREQALALGELHAERRAVETRESALGEALAEAASTTPGLQVHALGPLHAERDGEPVRRWGGEKAGSRQAEGIFAFLFDRGERGASKDEILELIWPDVDLERADVAFHRTMLGLRSMLNPGRGGQRGRGAIAYHHDRYRLDPSAVAWSDLDEFERLLAEARDGEPDAAIGGLERARRLYRGDYLDDCPYYGDSAPVEDRRDDLRRRYVDLLVELGDRYAARGDRSSAAARYRDAQAATAEEVPRIAEALGGLGAARVDP